jgi:four helix bundle protein
MLGAVGMAHKVEDLPIFHEARKFCDAVTATLERSRVPRNSNRYQQIVDANDSIMSNLDEGFEQSSDDGFANYVGYSKGSLAEVMRRLRRAALRKEIPGDDLAPLTEMSEPLGKMFGGFIKYLKRSGFKDRGRFRASQERNKLPSDPNSRSKDAGFKG